MSFRSVFALLGVVWVSACSSNESGGTVGTGAASSFGGGYGGNLPMGGIGGRAANGGAVASGGTSVAGASGSNAGGFGGWSPGTGGLMASGAGGLVAGGGGSSTAGAGGSASGTGGSGVGGTGGASSVGGSAGAGNDPQCPGPSEPANQSTCTGVVAGTYCTYGSDSCLCKHKNYMGAWTCLPANASCESVAPGDSTACTGKVGADCLYPNVECVCGVDELWHCTVEQNPACPPGPTYPSGDCTGKEGLSCNYGYIDCFCGGSHTWFCLA
ncbi:MAG TPA: hypothetical protein VGJ84_00795 [Polyangiaceae bacterium]